MTESLDPATARRALRRVAQLRSLFRRLPHLPTPAENRLLAEFEAFAAGARESCSVAALAAGFQRAFRAGDRATITAAAARAAATVETDRDLWAYREWATRRG